MSIIGHNSAPVAPAPAPAPVLAAPTASATMASDNVGFINATIASVSALNSTINSILNGSIFTRDIDTILARDIDSNSTNIDAATAAAYEAYEGPSVLGLFVGLFMMYTLYELLVILHCVVSGKEVWPAFVRKTYEGGVRGVFRDMWNGIVKYIEEDIRRERERRAWEAAQREAAAAAASNAQAQAQASTEARQAQAPATATATRNGQ